MAVENAVREVSMLRLTSEQNFQRTSQMMADNSVALNHAANTTLNTINGKLNQGMIELSPMEAQSYSVMDTKISATSQMAHASRDQALLAAIGKIGS